MSDRFALRGLWRHGAVAAAIATAVNLTLLAVGRAVGGTFVVAYGSEPVTTQVGAGTVTVFTAIAMALGLAVTVLVTRRHTQRLRTMQIIGAAVALVSLFQPLAVDTDTTTRTALVAMHLISGTAFVAGLQRLRHAPATGPRPRAQPAGTANDPERR